MPDVRKATPADIDPMAEVLAASFNEDPILDYLFPQPHVARTYRRFFEHELRSVYLKHDETWTTVDGVRGAALWAPPGKWKVGFWEIVRSAPLFVRLMGRRLPRGLRALGVIEGAHPPGDHYYLAVLGTEPSAQGLGVGSALMAPVLQRCDQQGLGAYLESSKERNVPFYARHGFEVTRELALPGGGPKIWPMWREPRG